jgi:HlyD family secretion protein
MMRRRARGEKVNKKIIPPIVAVALLIAAAAYYFSARDSNGEAPLHNGTLEAADVDVRAQVGGQVMAMLVDDGDPVKEGQLLCELDTRKLELQVRGAEGQLKAQQARLEAMNKGARDQEIEQVRLLLDQARVQKEKAEKDYGRIGRLFAQNAVSEFDRDNARTMRDLAVDQESRADQQYKLVMEGVRDEELKAQLAVVDATQAQLDYAQIQLEDAKIKSPLTGRVVERYLEAGELAMPGGLVATIADYRRLKVNVYVPEDQVGALKLGQKAAVMVDSFPGREFEGRIVRKSNAAEFTPKNVQTREERITLVYEVTVLMENPEELALAGLPADVRFLDEVVAAEPTSTPEPGATVEPQPGATTLPTPEPGSTAETGE